MQRRPVLNVSTVMLAFITVSLTMIFIRMAGSEVGAANLNPHPKMQIFFKEGTLSVSLSEAVLGDVLQEVTRQTNISINHGNRLKEKISMEFNDLPVEEGLKRLLKNQNHSFVYSQNKDSAGKKTTYTLNRVILLDVTQNWRNQILAGGDGNDGILQTPVTSYTDDVSESLIEALKSQIPEIESEILEHLPASFKSLETLNLEMLNEEILQTLKQFSEGKITNISIEDLEMLSGQK